MNNSLSQGIYTYTALKLHVLTWKKICIYALKHQKLFFLMSNNQAIDYEKYDLEILNLCKNDFQFAQFFQGDKNYNLFKNRESIVFRQLFVDVIDESILKLLTVNYIQDYFAHPEEKIAPYIQSRKTVFEGLGAIDHIHVVTEDILDSSPKVNPTSVPILLNRFRRIYLMRRLLFFNHLEASMAILECDDKAKAKKTDDFYQQFQECITNGADYEWFNLLAASGLQDAMPNNDPNAPVDPAINDAVKSIENSQKAILDILKIQGDDKNQLVKLIGKVDELHKQSDNITKILNDDSLSQKWKKGSFFLDKKAYQKVLSDNLSEVATSLSEEIGQGFINLLYNKEPSLKDKEFWYQTFRSIGPMVCGLVGTVLGGPIGGALLVGMGKSFFGAVLGQAPDPVMDKLDALGGKIDQLSSVVKEGFADIKKQLDQQFSVVDGKLDQLSYDLKQVFSEVKSQIDNLEVYIQNQFKDLQSFGSVIDKIQNSAIELSEHFNIISRYYGEILFKENRDGTIQIEQDAKDLIGREEKVLDQLENIVKKLYHSAYQFNAKSDLKLPDSADEGSLIQQIINAHASPSDARRFDATIDYLMTPLNVVDNLYRTYYQKRGSLFAALAALFTFHREKTGGADVLANLKSMCAAEDRINAALLLHPSLLKANSIGTQNMEFYNLVHSYRYNDSFNFLHAFSLSDAKNKPGWFELDKDGNPGWKDKQPCPRFYLVPDTLADAKPFKLKYWTPGLTKQDQMKLITKETQLQICLGADDTLVLFKENNPIISPLRYDQLKDEGLDGLIQTRKLVMGFPILYMGMPSGQLNKNHSAMPGIDDFQLNTTISAENIQNVDRKDRIEVFMKIQNLMHTDIFTLDSSDYFKRMSLRMDLSMKFLAGSDEISLWCTDYTKVDHVDVPSGDDRLIGIIKAKKILDFAS